MLYMSDDESDLKEVHGVAKLVVKETLLLEHIEPAAAADLWQLRYGTDDQTVKRLINDKTALSLLASLLAADRVTMYYDRFSQMTLVRIKESSDEG